MPRSSRMLAIALLGGWAVFVAGTNVAQDTSRSWNVTKARGQTRLIDFTTDEGTWMSVDIAPDGRWIVFDLLAHIYRVAVSGGKAECLTESSGVALNYQPRFSPDGKTIAFVSDRMGQNNLWLMDSNGDNPRPVFTDPDTVVAEPTWTPDSQYIVVRQQHASDHSEFEVDRLWMYHRDGGAGVELTRFERGGAGWPSVSPDGRSVYYHVCHRTGPRDNYGCEDFIKGNTQLQRIDLGSGEIVNVTAGPGGAVAPEVSPDGRWLAFARRIPNGTISHMGHRFGPRTALWLRDLRTGAERVLMDPIELDLAERQHDVRPIFFMVRMLPGYSWARDARSIVLSQGGKIRRLWLDTGRVETIPFTAHVRREISEMANASFRISDGPFQARYLRWHTASPDAGAIAFQAIGKIWITEPTKSGPRRLTPSSFAPCEFAPAWSPDGQWIAFTSWDDVERGHLWRVPASGGDPTRLTVEAGEYSHPVWSPDGRTIVVTRGSGATARRETWANNVSYELVTVPSAGGTARRLVSVHSEFPPRRGQIARASFGPDNRVYYVEQNRDDSAGDAPRASPVPVADAESQLVSVKSDGTRKQVHLKFAYADEAAISPDGRWVAFQEGGNVYLTAVPPTGAARPVIVHKRSQHLTVEQISFEGGLFPRWRDSRTVEFGSADRYFAYHLDSSKLDVVTLRLTVPRRIPEGAVALTGARIITLDKDGVIDKGSIIIRAGRIACVGECDIRGAERIFDVSGKTIVPGFVDMHAHHHARHQGILPRQNFESAVYLAYGVTTTLDPAAWSQNVFPSAELIKAGAMIGPRTFSTGDPLYGGDSQRQNAITSYRVAEQNVNRLASWGAVTIKQYLQPRREQRQWIIDVARRRSLRVTGEINDHEYNLSMIMDGQTGFEHPLPYLMLYSDLARFYGQAGTFYSPTFLVGGPSAWNEDFFFQETDIWKNQKQRDFLPWSMLVPHARRRMLRPATDYSFPFIAQGLADIIAAGGNGAIGGHGEQHGIGSHWEIWMAASALGPMGALEVASLHGARFLGADQDLGSITIGKLADLLVLNSNPLDSIRNTTDLLYVVKGGVFYDASTLDEVWPERRPYGHHPWIRPEMLQSDDRPLDYWDRHPR